MKIIEFYRHIPDRHCAEHGRVCRVHMQGTFGQKGQREACAHGRRLFRRISGAHADARLFARRDPGAGHRHSSVPRRCGAPGACHLLEPFIAVCGRL